MLLTVAGGVVVYWLLLASGAIRLEGEAWNWTISQSLGHLFVALTAAWAARLMVRGATRAPLVVALAAGGLIVVAIEGLVHLVVNGDLSQISLAVRTDILTRTAMLAIGIWASSYALRAERRPPAP